MKVKQFKVFIPSRTRLIGWRRPKFAYVLPAEAGSHLGNSKIPRPVPALSFGPQTSQAPSLVSQPGGWVNHLGSIFVVLSRLAGRAPDS